jgi:broad specificity phosphatase PhoE
VFTSTVPRALETALAMGFAVDDQVEALGDIPPGAMEEVGHHERWGWEEPFVAFARIVRQGGATARMAERQWEAWVRALESAPAGGRVLIISHGRIIESGLVACVPDGDFAAWGPALRHCEGARLTFADGRFQGAHLLRVSPPTAPESA